jgi:hypothetical protein
MLGKDMERIRSAAASLGGIATSPPLPDRFFLLTLVNSYVEGAIYQLKYFEQYHHEDGVKELNDICSAHVLTMDLDVAKKFSYCGCVVDDRKLVIVFNRDNLGVNANDALNTKTLLEALNDAPPAEGSASKISHAARTGIRQDYDPKIEDVRSKVATMISKPELKFEPNWDELFAKLSAEKKRKGNSLDADWESRLGYYAQSYFEGLEWMMRSQKFDEDDMLQEGFNEGVEKSEVALRIVDKLKYASYCEVVVEDGVLYIQVRSLPCSTGSPSA